MQIDPRSNRTTRRNRLSLTAIAVSAVTLTCGALTGAVAPARADAPVGATKVTTVVVAPAVGHLRTITYEGLSVTVPASWPVVDLSKHPTACVRVDRHAVYLGTPAADQNCPARIQGHTEALLLTPAAALRGTQAGLDAAASPIGTAPALTRQARQLGQFSQTFADARVSALATFGAHPETARAALASITEVSASTLPDVGPARSSAGRVDLAPGGAAAGLTDRVDYGEATTGTYYGGLGFDTCASPSSAAMQSWLVSPFRSVGIYIGGRNRACMWGNLSATWVSAVTSMGWRLQPIYVGLQPSCTDQGGMADISSNATTARAQGAAEGTDAVSNSMALGLYPGSAVYSDIEGYDTGDATCVASTMAYLDGFVRAVHDHGYLAGVYSSAYSAILNLAQRYESPTQARPDMVWTARWDGVATTEEKVLLSGQWAYKARAKQYRGDHTDVYGGVSIRIDSNRLNSMVASVAYTFHTRTIVNVRTAPTTSATLVGSLQPGAAVRMLCQSAGLSFDGDAIWNKLTSGSWISDRNVTTSSAHGYSTPVPKCTVVYQTWRTELPVYAGPSTSSAFRGVRAHGSLTHTLCQKLGTKVGDSSLWDKLSNGNWVADYNVGNGLKTWNPSIPRCR